MKKMLAMLLFTLCVVFTNGFTVHAEEIIDGDVFECEEGTGSAQWVLNDNGDLVLSGTGSILNLVFPTEEEFRSSVKKVYCSTPMVCNDLMDLEGVFSNMVNVESINLKLMKINSVRNADSLFSNCPSLKYINMQNINLSDCEYAFQTNGVLSRTILVKDMFKGCNSLEEVYMYGGYLGELPELADGYNWSDENGNTIRNYQYYSSTTQVIYNKDGGKISKTPIKYNISYSYTVYDKAENGTCYYDSDKGIMVSDVWNEGKGKYAGINHQGWENNTNPLYYTIEDGEVKITAPDFTVEGYELVNYSPKTIDTTNLKSVEVEAFFLPKEDVVSGDNSEIKDDSDKSGTTENTSSTETPSTTEQSTTQASTVADKKTETSTNSNAIPSTQERQEVVVQSELTKGSIKSIKNTKGKKAKISIALEKGCKYQIKMSTSKAFKKNVKTYVSSKSTYTVTKLKKGTTYYFKTRPYKKVNGKTVYGTWSNVKKVKIKK